MSESTPTGVKTGVHVGLAGIIFPALNHLHIRYKGQRVK